MSEPPKPSENEALDRPKSEHKVVQMNVLPGLPLQPNVLCQGLGNSLQKYEKQIPKKNIKKSIFSIKAVCQPRKPSENEAPDPSKIDPNSPSILEGPKLKNKQTLPHFSSFLDCQKPSKIVEKRTQKRCETISHLESPGK